MAEAPETPVSPPKGPSKHTNGRGFARWFIATQATQAKTEIWQSFFKDFIAMVLVCVYATMILASIDIPPGFDLLLGMVLGFYFKSNRDTSLGEQKLPDEEEQL